MKFALLSLFVFTGIALCRQVIAQKAVETVFRQTTGFPIRIQLLEISPWDSRFAAEGVQLFNPPGFSDRLFVTVPRVYVDYEFGSLFLARPQITRADLHIREIVIVKNTNGQSNVEQLRGLGMYEGAGRPVPRPFQIDTLHLQIGRVITKDYSDGGCKESTRDLDMTVTFRNVTEKTDINRRIFYAVLRRIWFGGISSARSGMLVEQRRPEDQLRSSDF